MLYFLIPNTHIHKLLYIKYFLQNNLDLVLETVQLRKYPFKTSLIKEQTHLDGTPKYFI